eukprot:CAMPEP_0204605410 /NCGR_PEP_ID=MMETSP0661-20131031/58460_1 /ASSEMBLY_ACC=CAM_ASM_000606 /TAXON_ID=109239 /ORGANISM="Alexandrium margalefi, Strain AMGDE01CS-322" /LENGTH=501 /DNA_ID=CAMNT_0051616651 /DNA_START=51 /DNA_END=1556 /DNA_ORIENTATION=+
MRVSMQGVKGALSILLMATAIEVLYVVPYGLTAAFRPLLRETFHLSNHDVGRMSSAYGIVSMCFYLPGGYIADRFQPTLLMVTALLTTAGCCCYLMTGPSLRELVIIWSVLAVAGTLLFWSAFLAAIRQIGGGEHSGKAFGLEQFSRGLVSSLLTLALATWMQHVLPVEQQTTAKAKAETMGKLLTRLAIIEVAMALMVVVALPSRTVRHVDDEPCDSSSGQVCQEVAKAVNTIFAILKRPAVWFHALIIISAYCGNLATSYFSGLATYGYDMDVVRAAEISTIVTWTRAVAGILAGMAADRCGRSRICCVLFLAYGCAYSWVAWAPIDPNHPGVLKAQIAVCAGSVFAIAGVYFTLLDDARLPLELTGSAVGTLSVVGFTPDIFMGQISAYWLDTYPGALGYQYFYFCMACIGFVGFLVTLAFAYVVGSCGDAKSVPQQDSVSDVPAASCTYSSSTSTTSAAETSASSVNESTSILGSEATENPSQRMKNAPYGASTLHD